jgi:hypothetical protein
VLNFRGSVTDVKAKGTRIIVQFEINPKWDLPMSEKVKSLKEWIPAKVNSAFRVMIMEMDCTPMTGQISLGESGRVGLAPLLDYPRTRIYNVQSQWSSWHTRKGGRG